MNRRCDEAIWTHEKALPALPARDAEAFRFLLDTLPAGDLLSCSTTLLLSFVRDALRVRDLAPWSDGIPEDIFRAYVLHPRVNDEPLEDHRQMMRTAIWSRVAGLSMAAAALEVNYWCLEQATYRLTDERTASPLTVMRRAFGRCGEESTLLVCALRAVGIPARQCYTPRWAHCDDNHAWVEAWVDGGWHYMGACEPELTLDTGWFSAAASRAMLVHARGFGWRGGDEPLLDTHRIFSTINRTAAYAQCRTLTVTVTENGQPRRDVHVRFELANLGELFPIHEGVTDEAGAVRFLTGIGSLHLHLHDGARYLTRVVDLRKEEAVGVDFAEARPDGLGQARFDLVPPEEAPVHLPPPSREALERQQERLRECAERRQRYEQSAPPPQGNGAQIEAFLADDRFSRAHKQQLLETLTEKDLADVTAPVLEDALLTALPYEGSVPTEVWQRDILSPRVEREKLFPVRAAIRRHFEGRKIAFQSGREVWDTLRAQISLIDDAGAERFACADSREALLRQCADRRSLDLLFVQTCRTFGIAARLNPVTGVKEAYCLQRQAYRRVEEADDVPGASLTLVADAARALEYGVHFTIGRLAGGVFHTLRLHGMPLAKPHTLRVPSGILRLVTCARQIDGTVLTETTTFRAAPWADVTLPVALRQGNLRERLKHVRLDFEGFPPLQAFAGYPLILAFVEPKQEPTEHLLKELLNQRERINSLGIGLALVRGAGEETSGNIDALGKAIDRFESLAMDASAYQRYLRRVMGIGDLRLPLAVAVSGAGEGLFAFANYSIGSAEALTDILALGPA